MTLFVPKGTGTPVYYSNSATDNNVYLDPPGGTYTSDIETHKVHDYDYPYLTNTEGVRYINPALGSRPHGTKG